MRLWDNGRQTEERQRTICASRSTVEVAIVHFADVTVISVVIKRINTDCNQLMFRSVRACLVHGLRYCISVVVHRHNLVISIHDMLDRVMYGMVMPSDQEVD